MCTRSYLPASITIQELYDQIKDSASGLAMGEYLPNDYRILNETTRQARFVHSCSHRKFVRLYLTRELNEPDDDLASDDSSIYDTEDPIFTEPGYGLTASWAKSDKVPQNDGLLKVAAGGPATIKTVSVLHRLLRSKRPA